MFGSRNRRVLSSSYGAKWQAKGTLPRAQKTGNFSDRFPNLSPVRAPNRIVPYFEKLAGGLLRDR